MARLAEVSSWGRVWVCVRPSDCSTGVSSWGTTEALSLETGMGLGCGKGKNEELNVSLAQTCDGEGRQGAQDIEKNGGGLSEGKRCSYTGTPTFGLPPVLSGPVAFFMSFVYAVFDLMILHVGPWWVLFQPCNQQ